MNDDDKRMFLALVKGKDISEIMSLLAESGNQYSRRILRFCLPIRALRQTSSSATARK